MTCSTSDLPRRQLTHPLLRALAAVRGGGRVSNRTDLAESLIYWQSVDTLTAGGLIDRTLGGLVGLTDAGAQLLGRYTDGEIAGGPLTAAQLAALDVLVDAGDAGAVTAVGTSARPHATSPLSKVAAMAAYTLVGRGLASRRPDGVVHVTAAGIGTHRVVHGAAGAATPAEDPS